MVDSLIAQFNKYKKRRYLRTLVKRGLIIGKNVGLEGRVFIDPSHCFLITIEDNCRFANNVLLLAHDASPFYIGITKVGRVTIKEGSTLTTNVVVLPGVTIGPRALIGANSVVMHDIPPNSVATGNPARVVCTLDRFLALHAQNRTRTRTFQESVYNIGVLTEERKREMLDFLDRNKFAYMEGKTEDNFVYR